MKNASELILNNTAKLSTSISKLKSLKAQIEKENVRFNKILAEHYAQTGEEINSTELKDNLGPRRAYDIIIRVLEKRKLSSTEILQPLILEAIERIDFKHASKIQNNLELTFDSIDKKSKVKFAFYCSGVYPLYKKYPFASKFLLNNYGIKEYDTESYLTLYGFNPAPVNEMRMSVLIKNKDKVGASKIATDIFNLINDIDVNNIIIDINNSRNATMEIKNNQVRINGHFIHRFTSVQTTLLNQINECTDYISVNIPCDVDDITDY